jgi:Transposase, Mutator family
MAPPRVPSRKWLEFEGGVISGCFGTVEIAVPRARIGTTDGGTGEWKSTVLPRYARMTKQVEALIAGAYLAGTNTRRAPGAGGAVQGCCRQGRGQPHLAESEDGLGSLSKRSPRKTSSG